MRRHDLDWVSLIAGAIFTGLALVYIVTGITDVSIDGRFVWPIVLVALGAAGVTSAIKANQREEQQFPVTAGGERG